MAKVTQENRNLLILRYTQNQGDEDYGTCMWADFLFDLDEYQLNINSDCGSYSYGWVSTPTESFLKLMARINMGYLLGKIAKEDCVDVDATRGHLESLLEEEVCAENLTESSAEHLMMRLEDELSSNYGPAEMVGALLQCNEAYGSEGLDWESFDWAVETDYSANAKKIAEVFEEFIQPKIKELLEVGT